MQDLWNLLLYYMRNIFHSIYWGRGHFGSWLTYLSPGRRCREDKRRLLINFFFKKKKKSAASNLCRYSKAEGKGILQLFCIQHGFYTINTHTECMCWLLPSVPLKIVSFNLSQSNCVKHLWNSLLRI